MAFLCLDVGDSTLSVGCRAGSSLGVATAAAAGGCEGLAAGVAVAGGCHIVERARHLTVGQLLALE